MDAAKLILTESILPPSPLNNTEQIEGLSEERKIQLAKDFESILINKLLDEMKNTIGEWGFEQDGANKQIQGIFTLYLARDIANNGGFGFWKDIYRFFNDLEQAKTASQSLDKNV